MEMNNQDILQRVEWNNFPELLTTKIKKLYTDHADSMNIKIKCQGEEILAHSWILSLFSEVFVAQSDSTTIIMDDISPKVMKHLCKLCIVVKLVLKKNYWENSLK